MTRSRRRYGGQTAEARREHRRVTLLESALDLVAEAGMASVSKRAVCARAKLNDRYFYEHFADSDALLEELARGLAHELAGVMFELLADGAADLADQVRAGVGAAIDFFEDDPRRAGVLLGPPSSEALAAVREASIRTVADALTDVLHARSAHLRLDRIETTMVAYASVSGARDLVAAWMRGEIPTTRDHLVEVTTAMVLAVFDMAAPRATTTGGVA